MRSYRVIYDLVDEVRALGLPHFPPDITYISLGCPWLNRSDAQTGRQLSDCADLLY